MKKISLIAIGLLAGLSVSAQVNVVKDAEKQVKNKDYAAALSALQAAKSNPETASFVDTWYFAGKAGVGQFDEVGIQQQLGQATPEQVAAASKGLVQAYKDLVKALPLDSVPDAKGKVKAKRTKDIKKTIGENYRNYLNAGLNLYNSQDYPAAYEAWDLYVTLPNNPYADEKAFVADADSTVGEIAYYQALAAYFNKDYANALDKVKTALGKGYKSKNVFIVGMEAADNVEDKTASADFARQGNQLYGSDDISFLANTINTALNNKDYATCYQALQDSKAVAANDSIKSLIYNVEAIINENEGKIAEAKANLQKSIDLFPTNAKSYFDMGRLIQNEVAAQEETADDATRLNVLVPEIKEAIKFYEKSYELDPEQSNLPGYIYRLYYQLDQNYHLGQEYADKAEYWKNL